MTGKYRLYLSNNRLVYDFVFERHINILNGDSSSGKSEFVDLLQTSIREIRSNGRSIAKYYSEFDWVFVLTPEYNTLEVIVAGVGRENIGKPGLIVADEDTLFFLKEWAIKDMVRGLDCYVLLITRSKKGIGSIPYSVKSVYEMQTVKKLNRFRVSLVNSYINKFSDNVDVDMLITEDSDSGYLFYVKTLKLEVGTLKSKDKLQQYLKYKTIVLVVDSAAFGYNIYKANEIRRKLFEKGINLIIVLPESFEWLILRSKLLKKHWSDISKVYDKADSLKYVSWEEYFTKVLDDVFKKEYNLRYDKKSSDIKLIDKLVELQDGVYSYLEGDEVEIIYHD